MTGERASKPFPIQPRFLSFMRSIMICGCPNSEWCPAGEFVQSPVNLVAGASSRLIWIAATIWTVYVGSIPARWIT